MEKTEENYIKLDSFLKKVQIAETGGQAKMMIQSGEIKVNNEIETRRGKKLHAGDVVEAEGKKYTVE